VRVSGALRGLAWGYAAWLGILLGAVLMVVGAVLLVVVIGFAVIIVGYLAAAAAGFYVYRGGSLAWDAYEALAARGLDSGLVHAGALILRYSGLAGLLGAILLPVLIGVVVLPLAYLGYTLGAALYTAGLALSAERIGLPSIREPLLAAALGAALDLLGVTAPLGLILFLAGTLIAAGRAAQGEAHIEWLTGVQGGALHG